VSRRNRIIIWLAGIGALLGLAYASSPWILAGLIKHHLSALGLNDVQVSVGYPGWRGLSLHKLQFTTPAGEHNFFCQFTDVDIAYHVTDLAVGTVARIRVPVAVVRIRPAPGSAQHARTSPAQSARTIQAQPLAALVSGLWLSQLPVRELLLDQLTLDGRTPSDAVYTVQLSGNIRDAEAQVSGNITLPTPRQYPLAFSFMASKTGKARLSLSPSANAAEPMLEWVISTVTIDRDQIELNGVFHAKLQPWVPVLKPWLTKADWVSGLEGTVNFQWQTVLPPGVFNRTSDNEVRLTLKQLQGKGWNWDITGEARVHALGGRGREQPLSLKLLKLSGRYKELAFVGLNAEVDLEMGEGLRTTKNAQLSVDLLDVGFPIENIAIRFQLAQHARTQQTGTRGPIVRIEKAAAELLGGRAHSEPFALDFGQDKNQLMLQLEGIGLNEIVGLEQQEGLQGTGILDGHLPIEITPAGIQVTQGKLSARAPGGTIRYLPTEKVLALAQSNASVKMLIDALSNFQYHKLDVISDYTPEGDLALQVRLEGKNPEWQSGRSVNLNLNLEENIPKLLRSLQVSGEITERVREHYQNTR